MLLPRVIPCLDVKDGRVVKGVRFVDLSDEGDPPELAARYAAAGADEICFLDITAAPEGRGTLLEVVERTASRVFVPLTVGGGVRSARDMRDVLRAGADKVAVNTAAVRDPELIATCARRFGSQCVVISVDVRSRPAEGGWEVVVAGGRQATGLDGLVWIEHAVELGAGEVLLTSIDRDGTQGGFDIDLLKAAAEAGGFTVEFRNTAWDGIFAGLEAGEYDAVMSSVTITDERQQTMDFSVPYINAGQILVVRKELEGVELLADDGDDGAAVGIAHRFDLYHAVGQAQGGLQGVGQTGAEVVADDQAVDDDLDGVLAVLVELDVLAELADGAVDPDP